MRQAARLQLALVLAASAVLSVLMYCVWLRSEYYAPRLIRDIWNGNTNVIQSDIDNGASIERRTSVFGADNLTGFTPLMWACCKRNADIVRILLDAKADANAIEPRYGRSALHILFNSASASPSEACIRLLLQAGAHFDARTKGGETPLSMAIISSDVRGADALLEKISSSGCWQRDGKEYLAQAIGNRDAAMVECLLRHGADASGKSAEGLTMLDLARRCNAPPELVSLLQAANK